MDPEPNDEIVMRVPRGFTRRLFTILPAWLVVRTAFAAVDGTLAIEFGQKSRLGGILNESGDVFSDVALFLPLALVSLFSAASITALIFLAMFEFVGLAGTMLSGTRRLEGPLGKVDRSIVLALMAIAIAACGRLPEGAWFVVPALCVGLVVTIWNRLRCALVERGANRVILWILTTIIGVSGRSLAVTGIWSR